MCHKDAPLEGQVGGMLGPGAEPSVLVPPDGACDELMVLRWPPGVEVFTVGTMRGWWGEEPSVGACQGLASG